MKTLIISDTHLTHKFDEKKFLFLKNLFSQYDNIILNGDFWDGYSTTFDQFISSKWSGLFSLLKNKGAIYLFGNHDKKIFNDERMSLFSTVQKDFHLLTINTLSYHIEHGQALYPSFDDLFSLSRKVLLYVNFITHLIENTLMKIGSPQNTLLKRANRSIKNKLKTKKFPHWYLCGHTHVAEFDLKNKFVNSGYIQYGKATYLIIDSQGPSLQTQWYK